MKKIYLDWNVINHIHEIPGLLDYLIEKQDHFVFVYSPAHFSDLMRSLKKGEENEYFAEDLKRLDTICETHLMNYEDNQMRLYCCLPSEFYQKEGENLQLIESMFKLSYYQESICSIDPFVYDAICDNLRSIDFGEEIEIPMFGKYSNAYEFFECLFRFLDSLFSNNKKTKSLKMTITKDIPDKEIYRINDLIPQDVIGAIEELMAKHGFKEKIVDLVRNGLNENQKDNEMVLFQSVYLMLDILRYYSDKKGLWNIISDAEHAFYGSYCDVLVTGDSRMKKKAQAAYAPFGKDMVIIEQKELFDYLKEEISRENKIEEPLKDIFTDQHIPIEYNRETVYLKWVRLDAPFWGYFNKMEYRLHVATGKYKYCFNRDLVFEKCIYYSETKKFFRIIKSVLQKTENIDGFEKEFLEKYYANDKSAVFGFYDSFGTLCVLSVAETGDLFQPVLSLYCDP